MDDFDDADSWVDLVDIDDPELFAFVHVRCRKCDTDYMVDADSEAFECPACEVVWATLEALMVGEHEVN